MAFICTPADSNLKLSLAGQLVHAVSNKAKHVIEILEADQNNKPNKINDKNKDYWIYCIINV